MKILQFITRNEGITVSDIYVFRAPRTSLSRRLIHSLLKTLNTGNKKYVLQHEFWFVGVRYRSVGCWCCVISKIVRGFSFQQPLRQGNRSNESVNKCWSMKSYLIFGKMKKTTWILRWMMRQQYWMNTRLVCCRWNKLNSVIPKYFSWDLLSVCHKSVMGNVHIQHV